jgi:(E)-4-hydroxy-3-methylbut-2-enyl-diphosphate synthase
LLPKRRQTCTVSIGKLKIGSTEPVRIQSMLTSDTTNVEACIAEIARLDAVDCEIIRLTVPNQKSVDSLPAIRAEMEIRGIKRPLVADVHFNPQLAINVCEFVAKNLKSVNTQISSIRKNWHVLRKKCSR